jgi:ubiquinone/menaquinone biosynthesis C-methylase UbiE
MKNTSVTWKQFLKKDQQYSYLKGLFHKFKYFTAPISEAEKFLPADGSILDLGCGEGSFCRFIGTTCPKRNITGIDISEKRITNAKKYPSNKNINYLCKSVDQINGTNTFNAISIIHVLYLVPPDKQKDLLVECRRLLAKDGRLIILALDIDSTFIRMQLYTMFFVIKTIVRFVSCISRSLAETATGSRKNKAYYRSKDNYIKMLENLGFELQQSRLYKHFPWPYYIINFKKL